MCEVGSGERGGYVWRGYVCIEVTGGSVLTLDVRICDSVCVSV